MTKYPMTKDGSRLALLALAVTVGVSCRKVDGPGGESAFSAAEAPPVITTEIGIEMVLVPAGRFQMGSRNGEADESPAHDVWVDAFLMDRYEMTQEHTAELARGNPWLSGSPSHFKGPQRPVEMISWDVAALYCNERSRKEGLEPCYDEETGACNFEADGYRLPTEAEWEYACRAGTDADYHFGPDLRQLKQYAWYDDNSAKQTHPVGQKKPNAWGFFDMHGNVAEWCNDRYDEGYYRKEDATRNPRGPNEGERYVLRGGAWNCSPDACRSARRVGADPGFADACFAQDAVGFRCVRRAPADKPVEIDSPGTDPAEEELTGDGPPHRTGFLYGEVFLQHKTGAGHPERPERLEAIVARLEQGGLLSQLVAIEPAPAAIQWLTTVHKPDYVERVKRSCRQGYVDSPDAPACEESYAVAVAAVGGILSTIDAVMEGKIHNAFCAVRPPGHHALPDRAMGFCLLNNVAIAARYVQQKHKLPKVLIVDWDVHHGNGTQEVFYDDPTVLYFGIHRYPFYPGTGSERERGAGDGVGYTVNVPLPAGSGDREFMQAFKEKLYPAALEFGPDFVLISAGFDAHQHDPLGGMRVTTKGYAELTRQVTEIADQCAGGRLVSILEGGYNVEALAACVETHLRVLMKG